MIFTSKYTKRIPEVPAHEAALVGTPEDDVAVIDGVSGASFTYRDVDTLMEAVGSGLTKLGVHKGDVVAFYAPNSTNYVFGMLGCFSIGAVFTGVNNNYKPHELGHHLSDCQAKVVITVADSVPTVEAVLQGDEYDTCPTTLITIDSKVDGHVYFNDLLSDDGSAFPRGLTFNIREDLACILYSSGTTGLPKGVMLTHYNLTGCLSAMRCSMFYNKERLSPLVFLPLFHIFGVLLTLLCFCRRGRAIVLPGFKPDVFLKSIQDYKVSHLYLVPPVIHFLAKHPLVDKYDMSSVTHVFSGAAPLTEDIEKTFLQRFKLHAVYQAYGMTEGTATTVFEPFDKPVPGASGIVVPNTQVKILDLETREPLGVGQEGEVMFTGPTVMKGYLNNPEATNNCMVDGWMLSGDVGYFNEDGYLFITGRVKELIKHKGFQVAPAELEGLLLTHPGISDVAVIGIPDEAAGELPRAFVVKSPASDVTAEEISEFIKERLTKHKWLSGGVQFVDSVPKTASGKIVRREVKKLLKYD